MLRCGTRITVLVVLCSFSPITAAFSQSNTHESTGSHITEMTTSIEWSDMMIKTGVVVSLRDFSGPLPTVRREAETEAFEALPDHLATALADVRIDSYYTIADRIVSSSALLERFSTFATGATKSTSYVGTDFQSLHINFEHRIYPDLIDLFLDHTRAYSHKPYVGYYPSTAFTGIVIYAVGTYNVHGENGLSKLEPAFFPKIFDENMRLFFESGMVDPDIIREWGAVAYTDDIDLSAHRDRIGELPLRTTARGIFGENRTDILIPSDTVERIRAVPSNARLLSEGRILIICDLP